MSIDWQSDVLEFHRKFCPERIGTTLSIPAGRVQLLLGLIREELEELCAAMIRDDLPATADAMADLVYVVLGAATTCGINLNRVWSEIHRSNMAKEGGSKRADGKVLKPEGWTPPDIAAVLARQKPLGSDDEDQSHLPGSDITVQVWADYR